MATIITKNSIIAGNIPATIVRGEMAINIADGKLFYGSGSTPVAKEYTASLALTASYALSASYLIGGGAGTPAGNDTEVQFRSGSVFQASSDFKFIYASSSLQQGDGVLASGQSAHAEGNGTTARGIYSHAEGAATEAAGEGSHAEGQGTIAVGTYSHAEGKNTIASGAFSHAEGEGTEAKADYSHVMGSYTRAAGTHQFVAGQFNVTSSAIAAFILGNGTSLVRQSNLVFASESQFQISGSLRVTGSAYIRNLSSTSQLNVVTIDTASGQLFYTASNALGIASASYAVSSSFASTASYVSGSARVLKKLGVVLASGSWVAGALYTYTYIDTDILASASVVDFTPNTASFTTVVNAVVYPTVIVTAKSASFFSQNLPANDIVGEIVIINSQFQDGI